MDYQAWFIVGIIGSVLLNLLIIILIFRKHKEMNYIDVIIASLCFSDLFQAGIGYSIDIHNFYSSTEVSDRPQNTTNL